MAALAGMTTADLARLKSDVVRAIRDLIRAGRPAAELANFRHAIDNELASRGA
jgi:hypothetical protein